MVALVDAVASGEIPNSEVAVVISDLSAERLNDVVLTIPEE